MDSNAASAPDLITSLEAMIQASVTSILDRRLGPASGTLDAQIQTAVASTLDKRLGPAVGSLGNRMTSLVEQRLANAVSTLNFRVNTAVTAALEQRLGPVGSALTAQITFKAAPPPVLSSLAPPKAQVSGMVNGTKETNITFQAEKELGDAQPLENGAITEKEKPARKQSPAKQLLENRPTEKEQPVQKEAFNTTFSESGAEVSLATAVSGESNESTSNETSANPSDASKSAVYPLFANGPSTSKADSTVVLTAKPNAKTTGPSSSADKSPAKRKASHQDEGNKADDTGESDFLSSEEESDNQKPKRKRAKVKLDPPGYTNGPAIKFRRVSPKLTASAKNRGYPRVIDLKGFTKASNKQNLTIADVVATVLFNYDPLSLHAFMDMDQYPTFHFVRKESDRKVRSFAIERRREPYGVVMKVCNLELILGTTAR